MMCFDKEPEEVPYSGIHFGVLYTEIYHQAGFYCSHLHLLSFLTIYTVTDFSKQTTAFRGDVSPLYLYGT